MQVNRAIPGHPGWYFSVITHVGGELETEVYFEDARGHDYPGILVRGRDHGDLMQKCKTAIDQQRHFHR